MAVARREQGQMKNLISRYGLAVLGAVATGLILYLYGVMGNAEESAAYGASAVGWMIGRWNWPAADMSHGWVIPFVSGYAIWLKRREFGAALKRPAWPGLVVVVLALLTYLASLRIQQTRLVLVSLIGLLWGVPFFLYGRRIAGLLVFPCGYLIFCVPLTFIDSLTLPLRLISTTVSAGLLNGLGISVTRIGTAIHVNAGAGFALDVAHPCSGLRYLLAMVALTTAYAYFTQPSPLRRSLLCVSAVPLAMAGNIARIVLIAVVGTWFGTDIALGFYHDYSGYVVFAVAASLMIALGGVLQRRRRAGGSRGLSAETEGVETQGAPRSEGVLRLVGAAAVVGLLIVTAFAANGLRHVGVAGEETADVRPDLPAQVGEWQGEEVLYCQNEQCLRSFSLGELAGKRVCPVCGSALDKVALGERTLLPPDTLLVRKVYRHPQGGQVYATVVVSGSEQKSIHRPQQCLPAQGFAIERSGIMAVPYDKGGDLRMTLLRARPGRAKPGSQGPRMLMAYWFAGGGHETPSHVKRLVWMAWDNLAHGIRARWAYVSIQTVENGAAGSGEKRIAEFARALYPLVRRSGRHQ